MAMIRHLLNSIILLIIMMGCAHFMGVWGLFLLLVIGMLIHIAYRYEYGHWIGEE